MMKIPPLLTTISNFMNFSLRRIILVTLFVVALIPLVFILPSLGTSSWESVYKDNLQKHKILATNLVDPIKLQLKFYQNKLRFLDIKLQSSALKNNKINQQLIKQFIKTNQNIVSVSLLLLEKSNSPIVEVADSFKKVYKTNPTTPEYIAKEIRYQKYDQNNSISPIFLSTISKTPVLLLKNQLIDSNFNKIGTLFTEVEPNFIKSLCSNITFGKNGFCTVIDNKNNVVAHPNPSWVLQTKNLAKHKLVQKLKSSNAGSLMYLTSSDNTEMIGGYAKIKKLNWGVLVTRPKSEIDLPLNMVRTKALIWLAIGLVFALFVAIIVILNVTRPLNILSNKTKVLTQKRNTYSLGAAPKHSPSDILSLWKTLSDLLNDFQELNSENIILESSSKKDIRKVMGNRREQIIKKDNNIDPITGLTNISCFLEELRKSLLVYRGEIAGLIIVEIDNYKPLIEKGKDPLADYIVKHVAKILNASKRNDDMVTRYGNAGRFAIFISDCNPKALQGMAKKLRSLVEVSPLEWKKDTIYINLSTGIVAHRVNEKTTVTALMSLAEKALDITKNTSNSNVASIQNKEIETS